MSRTTLLPGVRLHPNGASYQVRVHPFPARGGFATISEAHEYAIELRRRKRHGILAPPTDTALSMRTLAEVAHEHLARLEAVGGRRGRPYSAAGLQRARNEARPWLGEPATDSYVRGAAAAPPAVNEGGVPFGALPLAALDVRSVEVYLERRATATPRAAAGEHQALQAILRLAARRGDRFDQGLLALDPVRRRTRRRHGLPLDQLRYLAAFAPEQHRRVFLLGATLGCRLMELLHSEDAWLDPGEATLTIPAWACKERREKTLDLLPEELALFREQRLARSPRTVKGAGGTLLLFPRQHGTAWANSAGFWVSVVYQTRRAAAEAWRADHGLDEGAATPFCDWQPHDLRRGAATLLRSIGVDAALVAARLGHADQGQLVESTYATDTRRERLRVELAAIAAEGGIDARLAAADRRFGEAQDA